MEFTYFLDDLNAYVLVFCRVAGMFLFNPLLSRSNIPTQFLVSIVLGITMLITPGVTSTTALEAGAPMLISLMVLELLVGFACGYVFQVFYYLLFTAGDAIDMGFGLAMAKSFDPSSNIQMSMSGNLFQIIFVMYFFVTGSHRIFIMLINSSYDVVSMGGATFGADVGSFIATTFVAAFGLIMQLALPFMAAVLVLEISIGILMRFIPQINVFAIHFQFKILFGITLLFLFSQPVNHFMRDYINQLFMQLQSLLAVL